MVEKWSFRVKNGTVVGRDEGMSEREFMSFLEENALPVLKDVFEKASKDVPPEYTRWLEGESRALFGLGEPEMIDMAEEEWDKLLESGMVETPESHFCSCCDYETSDEDAMQAHVTTAHKAEFLFSEAPF